MKQGLQNKCVLKHGLLGLLAWQKGAGETGGRGKGSWGRAAALGKGGGKRQTQEQQEAQGKKHRGGLSPGAVCLKNWAAKSFAAAEGVPGRGPL